MIKSRDSFFFFKLYLSTEKHIYLFVNVNSLPAGIAKNIDFFLMNIDIEFFKHFQYSLSIEQVSHTHTSACPHNPASSYKPVLPSWRLSRKI